MKDNTGKKTPVVPCPGCGRDVRFDAGSPFRPFCSERCRLIDLGAWANENYRIPEQTPPDGMPGRDDP
ncbi:MAG: DNA gyrase inhibitor YacG [Pseudomonadota bacterium]